MSEVTPAKPVGAHYGADFTFEEYESIGLQHLRPDLFKDEARLFKTKWFDYTAMHPVQATYHFAYHYSRAFRRMMCRREGIERGQYRRGFKGDDIFALTSRQYHGFWRARRQADAMGIPYDFYCSFAMRWANDRLWKMLPSPQQLYSELLVKELGEAWVGESRAAIRIPTDPRFLLENYIGHEDQDRFQHWLCMQILTRPNQEFALSHYVHLEPRISKEIAAEYFTPEVLNRAACLFP